MNTCPDCKNDLVCHDQGECLRPTPETDSAFDEFRETCDLSNLEKEMADLERQRNKAREFAKDLTDKYLEASGLLQRQLAEAREENARLREAVSKVLNFIPAPTCDQMHHTKKDRHGYGKTCPPVERVKAIIDNARKILTP